METKYLIILKVPGTNPPTYILIDMVDEII